MLLSSLILALVAFATIASSSAITPRHDNDKPKCKREHIPGAEEIASKFFKTANNKHRKLVRLIEELATSFCECKDHDRDWGRRMGQHGWMMNECHFWPEMGHCFCEGQDCDHSEHEDDDFDDNDNDCHCPPQKPEKQCPHENQCPPEKECPPEKYCPPPRKEDCPPEKECHCPPWPQCPPAICPPEKYCPPEKHCEVCKNCDENDHHDQDKEKEKNKPHGY